MRQAKLQDVCEQIVDDVDGALGCALVDIATGLPLALDVKPGALLSSSAMELISAAGVAYFRDNLPIPSGPGANGDDAAPQVDYTQELQATTADTYNFMSLVPGDEQELLILIADRQISNLGLGWMAMRQALTLVKNANDDDNAAVSHADDGMVSSAPYETSQRVPLPNPEHLTPRVRRRRTIWGER